MVPPELDEIQALLKRGQWTRAEAAAEGMLQGGVSPVVQAWLYHALAVAHSKMGTTWDALKAARRAQFLASDLRLHDLEFKVLVNLVWLYSEVGDWQLSLETGEQLLAGNIPDDLRSQLPRVYYNLAFAHRCKHEYGKMHERIQMAIRLGEEMGASPAFLTMANQQAAFWLLLEDRIADADRYMEKSLSLLSEDDTAGWQEQTLLDALRAHQIGKMDEAMTYTESLVRAGANATLLQRAWAAYLAASAALHLDQVEAAATLIERAVELALELYSPEHLNRVNQLRIRIMKRTETAG